MFHSYQTRIDANGNGQIDISPNVDSVEWDIYQVSIQTQSNTISKADMLHNGFFLCHSDQANKDSAQGPPDVVVLGHDIFSMVWSYASPGDTATMGIWYNENLQGTTFSTAH